MDNSVARHWKENCSPDNEVEYILNNNPKDAVTAWNEAAKESTGDVLIQLSDDFACPKDWDKQILEAFERWTAQRIARGQVKNVEPLKNQIVLCVNDCNTVNPAFNLTLAIMTRARYEAQGCLIFPEYASMFSDDDLRAWAVQDDCLCMRADLKFPHSWLGNDHDDVAKAHAAKERFDAGALILARRKKEGFKPWPQST